MIIDTTSTFSALNLSMMDLSTLINFVGIVDFIPTIKNMKRGSDTLKELGYDDSKIRYVLNRSNAKTRIDVEDVEAILGKHFDYVLPNDFQTAQNSVRSGVPFVLEARHTPLAKELISIVDGYVRPDTEQKKKRPRTTAAGSPGCFLKGGEGFWHTEPSLLKKTRSCWKDFPASLKIHRAST